jgi:hypothetical protein
VKPSYGERLINVCGQVNGREILFVKDTGAEMTLIREEYVDSSNIIEGQRITLYTAVGQPFTAKMAIVNLDTPYFKGHPTVGLVAYLAADALLGMDILGKSKTYVVTRSKSKQNEEIENEMVECKVHSQDLNEDVDLIDFSEPDKEIQEDIDIGDVNELPEQGESIGLEHLSNVNVETLSRLQREDPTLSNCRLKALNNVDKSKDVKFAFYYENNVLKRKWESKDGYKRGNQIVLPKSLRKAVLELAHDRPMSGHLGPGKCKQRVLQSFYWMDVFADVTRHCRSCDICQRTSTFDSSTLLRVWSSFWSLDNVSTLTLDKCCNPILSPCSGSSLTSSISISSWISSSGSEKSIRSTSSFKSWECTSHPTISFSISSFCLLLDLVTTYVLDFPKISIPNRASAAKFATNPTIACSLKYGVSKLTTAIFAVKG